LAFKDVKFLLLKDKHINSDGSPTTDQQRDQFLSANPTLHRMLKRKEIENYLFDFEIVSKAYPLVKRSDYETLIPDINDDVKSQAGKLMGLCAESGRGVNKDNFTKLFAPHVTQGTNIYKELKSAIF
jgi:hypothetical protein